MKKHAGIYTLAFLSVLFSLAGFAQEPETKYLFSGKDKDVKVSAFAAVFTQFSALHGDFAVSSGGGAALIFNQGFFFGGYGQGVATRHEYGPLTRKLPEAVIIDGKVVYNETIDDYRMLMGHGGFWTGYVFSSHHVFHIMTGAKLGWGSVALTNDYHNNNKNTDAVYDRIFVMIPEVGAELNLTKWMKINATVGYRVVTGLNKEYAYDTGTEVVEKKYFESSDFNSIEGSINLVFGWFHQ
ncbi:MAG: hypothetical protein KKA81_11185 [Bacteroidetes bacterium]|nr:hypothetical protein [Bacteroidota bacterium]